MLETNYQEATAFIGDKIYKYLLISIVWCILCILILLKNYRKPLVWCHRSRLWVFLTLTLYFILLYFLNSQNQIDDLKLVQTDTLPAQEQNAIIEDLKKTYPLGIFFITQDFVQEQKKINNLFLKKVHFKFYAQQEKIYPEQRQIYVLVIGETGRRKSWFLNGYARQTNPILSHEKNLVNFSNMLAISNATRTAVPMILTRKSEKQVYDYNFSEKSIISVFKEAGFKTYWLSTQQKMGEFDTSTSVYAKEADRMIFLNKANYTDAGEHDDVIVPVLSKILESKEKKQFIVIHTLGSHYNYEDRYPKNFSIYQPTLSSLSNYSLHEKKYQKELTNSYDNSVIFTDYVLSLCIDLLKKQTNAEVFFFYSADHGESIFDENCDKSGHGLKTKNNFEIASFVWYSNQFQINNSKKIYHLLKNKDRKMNQTAIFPTLADAAHIKIKSDNLEKSILKNFLSYPRFILEGKNFDTSAYDDKCQEIQ